MPADPTQPTPSPDADRSPAVRSTRPAEPVVPDEQAARDEPVGGERLTFAGNRPLDTRWWWSPFLMIVVGVAVIGYQYSAITGDNPLLLNWLMVVIGGAVAVAGLVSLRRAYAVHRAAQDARASEPPA